ncbi:MAG: peptidoglycan-binding protein [Candidatus Fimenecus sp.]
MKNYLTYLCKVINITQGYTGNYSHGPHNTGSPKDYPWDEACGDTGRSPMYCPCDEMEIKRIYTKGTNTIWLESTSKVYFADGTSDYVTLIVTHPNDSDIMRLKVGQKFKRGKLICYEGTDGNATGNHFHFSAGKGRIKGNGWVQNSKEKWVLNCTNGADKPEKLFYIDPEFTTIKKTNGIKFKELPKEESFLPARGYFKYGDTHENIGKIAAWMRKNYPLYTPVSALGNYFGKNLLGAVKEYQRRRGLEQDGNIGPLTLADMVKCGFKY